jgi:hypothetical protein
VPRVIGDARGRWRDGAAGSPRRAGDPAGQGAGETRRPLTAGGPRRDLRRSAARTGRQGGVGCPRVSRQRRPPRPCGLHARTGNGLTALTTVSSSVPYARRLMALRKRLPVPGTWVIVTSPRPAVSVNRRTSASFHIMKRPPSPRASWDAVPSGILGFTSATTRQPGRRTRHISAKARSGSGKNGKASVQETAVKRPSRPGQRSGVTHGDLGCPRGDPVSKPPTREPDLALGEVETRDVGHVRGRLREEVASSAGDVEQVVVRLEVEHRCHRRVERPIQVRVDPAADSAGHGARGARRACRCSRGRHLGPATRTPGGA